MFQLDKYRYKIKMTLPAALQARLKKRGLITKEKSIEEPDEVVIKKGCPNAVNPAHECTDYCLQKYGAKGRAKIKRKNYKLQPLPPGWFSVPDPKSGHEYYWNVHTNQVSWRHPNDPRAEITYPASWQQKAVAPAEIPEPKSKEKANKTDKTDETNKEDKSSKSKVKTGKHPSLVKAQKQRERVAPYRKGKSGKDDDVLDPMDPASYSDIGRGTWSSGLQEDSDVNTGVDTTASGPLFQQRPYPSPGDILRRNKKAQPKDEE